jgi:hypothetical protein
VVGAPPFALRSCFTEAQAGTCGSATSVAEYEFSSTQGGRMKRKMFGREMANAWVGSRTFVVLVKDVGRGGADGCLR